VLLGDRGSRWRCLLVWVSGSTALGAVASALVPGARALADPALTSQPVDVLLARACACVLLACAGWAWLALTATVAEAWPGDRRVFVASWRLPSGVHRIVLAACGVALASGLGASAHAAAPGHPRPAHHGPGVLRGLPLPERAVAPARPAARPRPLPDRVVTVRPGDTLWAIAARDLPAGAPDHDIDSRWRAVYAANRLTIGLDPDLIRPGQRLRLPPLPRKDRP
jgi:LysM repeat protein